MFDVVAGSAFIQFTADPHTAMLDFEIVAGAELLALLADCQGRWRHMRHVQISATVTLPSASVQMMALPTALQVLSGNVLTVFFDDASDALMFKLAL